MFAGSCWHTDELKSGKVPYFKSTFKATGGLTGGLRGNLPSVSYTFSGNVLQDNQWDFIRIYYCFMLTAVLPLRRKKKTGSIIQYIY